METRIAHGLRAGETPPWRSDSRAVGASPRAREGKEGKKTRRYHNTEPIMLNALPVLFGWMLGSTCVSNGRGDVTPCLEITPRLQSPTYWRRRNGREAKTREKAREGKQRSINDGDGAELQLHRRSLLLTHRFRGGVALGLLRLSADAPAISTESRRLP
ncbi:hypothetical protein EYF80_005458 [Liparis tanakae]|uniref:Uncharacterized protein n=1 Tax=Liparis tanakae TaxID=230148 RepID=A0A4Z2J2F6_9TELE|nr:hypothetical protein EYF80_005458 [Liparis tanakae]